MNTRALLDFIAGPESGGNYNAYYGNTRNQDIRFTEMSLGEVLNWQRGHGQRTGSSAVGRYQFIQGTLRDTAQQMGIPMTAKFTPELQDQIATKLLERRGYQSYLSGEMTADTFANNLAKEWAGLPMVSGPKAGRSFYDGDAIGNKSGVSSSDFLNVVMYSGGKGGYAPHPAPRGPAFMDPQAAPTASPQGRTVGIQDVAPHNPYSHGELRQMEQERRTSAPSFGQGIQAAFDEEQMLSWLFRSNPGLAPEPGFRMSSSMFDEWTKDVPEQYWDRFEGVHSRAQGDHIRSQLMRSMENDRILAEMGGTGLALRIGAGVLDPVAWATGAGIVAATGGMGAPAAAAARFGRMGTVGLNAGIGAASNMAVDGFIIANRPTSELSELAMSAGLGLVLGAGYGALARNPALAEEQAIFERAGRAIYAEAEANFGSTGGAAQHSPREMIRADTADILRDGAGVAPTAAFGKARFDLAAQFKKSDNMMVRMLGNVLVEDGTRNAQGLTPIGASEVQRMLDNRVQTMWRSSYEPAFKDFYKRSGDRFSNRDEARRAFSNEVSSFVRNRELFAEFDPAVTQAGNTFRKIMDDWRQLAQNPGQFDGTNLPAIRGFQELLENPNYVPRIFNLGAVTEKLSTYGHARVSQLFASAIVSANKEITKDAAQKIAERYISKIHSLSAGELLTNYRVFSGEDMEGLRRILRDETEMGDPDIEGIVNLFAPRGKDGAPSRGKSRAFYDETFAMKIPRADGSGVDTVRITDFFNNDADELLAMYSRQMSGRVAMARLRVKNPKWQPGDEAPEYLIDGVTSDGDWERLLSQARDIGSHTGSKQLGQDIERLQFAYDAIVGRPVWDEGSNLNQGLRVLRDFNYSRVGNMMGAAQLPEIGNAVAQVGFKAMFSNMPSFRALWRNARTGKLDDVLAHEIELATGLGTEWNRAASLRRHDEFGNPLGGIENNKAFQTADSLVQKANRVTHAVSGMAAINTALQRWTAVGWSGKIAAAARKGKLKETRRLLGLNLDQAKLDRIGAQLNAHSKMSGGRLQTLGLDKWTDAGARADFEMALHRFTRTVIQENDLGQLNKLFSSPLARTFIQFRSFMLAAWSKQLLNGLNHRDWTTFASFATTAFTAGLVYIGRTHLQSAGRADRKEYLERQLAFDRIVAAGLNNSSWFTLMGPAIDTAGSALGIDPFFDVRSSGLASNALFGNPTADLFDGLSAASSTMFAGTSGGDMSQADLRRMKAILPFQNAIGITQLFDVGISPLPEFTRR